MLQRNRKCRVALSLPSRSNTITLELGDGEKIALSGHRAALNRPDRSKTDKACLQQQWHARHQSIAKAVNYSASLLFLTRFVRRTHSRNNTMVRSMIARHTVRYSFAQVRYRPPCLEHEQASHETQLKSHTQWLTINKHLSRPR